MSGISLHACMHDMTTHLKVTIFCSYHAMFDISVDWHKILDFIPVNISYNMYCRPCAVSMQKLVLTKCVLL